MIDYILRYMHADDIEQVIEVDKLSFPTPWSARSYYFEINDNPSSHMVSLVAVPHANVNQGSNGNISDLYGSNGSYDPAKPFIAGYGGMWLIAGESHISTIAVHPELRGKGLGEVLLTGMLARSISLSAEYSVLEVRVSNVSALNLYRKYEYQIVGRRKGYYRDNNEDAFQMHLAPLDSAYRARFDERVSQLTTRVPFENMLIQQFSKGDR